MNETEEKYRFSTVQITQENVKMINDRRVFLTYWGRVTN